MEREYGDCFYCGGTVREEFVSREIRWSGQLFIFENVPVGICIQCGEKIIKPDVAKVIDRILESKKEPAKLIEVPVYYYKSDVA